MKRGEKWFSEKLRKNFDLENVRSDSKERPAFRDRITRGSLESLTLIPNHPHDIYIIGLKCSPDEILAKNCLDHVI